MSNFRTLIHPSPVDTPTRLEQRPPVSRSGGSFLATQKGWPPYCPGYFGPFSTPKREPSAILDLRDKRYGKEARVGNPRFAQGSTPLPYHTLYFDAQSEGDWTHFQRFMPPGQMVRQKWPAETREEVRFPERGLADPSHLNRKNYRGYHFLPNYSRRYVVGDPKAPWNKSGDFTYTSWSTVLQQADFD